MSAPDAIGPPPAAGPPLPSASGPPVPLSAAGPPLPPPGPGVTPPFTAPPDDRNRRGLWLGLGIGAFLLVVCCAGGVFGVGLFAVTTTRQVEANATATVRTYLDALATADYEKAYAQLCPDLTRRTSQGEFAGRQQAQPRPESFREDKPVISATITVGADVIYADGSTARRRYRLAQQAGSQDLLICGGV
ncbi:MAG: hypothetical protein QOI74_2238 [Micromonosporaceae bacterium]|nr:hypothetical protein [Micromonosporaceae bacterium]